MSIADSTKIDKSFKFVSGKGFTTTQKSVDGEDAPSGFIVGTSSIFTQDGGIPSTAPGTSTSILNFYGDGISAPRFRMIYDISSPLNKAWYASTNGSTLTTMRATRVPNWVPPTFGNYTIRIFLTFGTSTTTAYLQEIFFSDSTSPLFDYKTGILTFESDPIAAYASVVGGPPDGIQISGYTYIGSLLSQIFDGNGNFTGGLSDFVNSGVGTAQAKFLTPSKTLFVSSPNAIGTTWSTETTPFSTVPEWHGMYVLPNGQIIAVGGDSGNTTPYIAYSYGSDSWYTSTFFNNSGIHRLNAVWAADNSNVYAVGQSGTTAVIYSANGGIDWIQLADPGIGSIDAIWGTTTTNIYIVAAGGTIYRSTNGTTFSAQTNSDVNNLHGIWGSSSTDIFAVGDNGTIRHSTGTGTWTGQVSGTSNTLHDVFGFSSSSVYAVGNSGTVLHYNGSSWSAQTGLPSTFFATSVWGTTNGGITRLYTSGNTNSGSGPGAIYFSDGAGTWTLQYTFGSGLGYSIYGSNENGVYAGSNGGNIQVLHQNPAATIQGDFTTDGYINAGLSVIAQSIVANRNINVLGGATTAININLSKQGTNTSSASFLPTAFSIFSTDAGTNTDYTVLTASSGDTGEGFRVWRESPTIYTIDLGSKTSTNNDNATPYSSGGRIRLGGFTISPSTTARGEIETVSSVGMNILAYQGDLTLSNNFGVDGLTKGDVNILTQNGGVNIVAQGNSPGDAGNITLFPHRLTVVNLSTNTTATYLEVLSPSGNFIKLQGDGSIINSGNISTTVITASSTITGTVLTGSTAIITPGMLTAGSILVAGGVNASTLTSGTTISGASISVTGNANAGNITSNGSITTNSNVRAANLLNQVRVGTELSGVMGVSHFGLHLNPNTFYGYCSAWGMGINPCTSNAVYETMSCFGARLVGVSGATVSIDHSTIIGSGLVAGQGPIVLSGFYNEVGASVRWQTDVGTTGFSLFGFLFVF